MGLGWTPVIAVNVSRSTPEAVKGEAGPPHVSPVLSFPLRMVTAAFDELDGGISPKHVGGISDAAFESLVWLESDFDPRRKPIPQGELREEYYASFHWAVSWLGLSTEKVRECGAPGKPRNNKHSGGTAAAYERWAAALLDAPRWTPAKQLSRRKCEPSIEGVAICCGCGKEFFIPFGTSGGKVRQFCKTECGKKFRAKKRHRLELVCVHCGEKYSKAHGRRRYCSQQCAQAVRTSRKRVGRLLAASGTESCGKPTAEQQRCALVPVRSEQHISREPWERYQWFCRRVGAEPMAEPEWRYLFG